MDKFMESPWFLRITALILALLLFFVVQGEEQKNTSLANSDSTDVIQNIPVEVYYDDENVVVTGVPNSVNMTISGPSSLVQTTKALRDFTLFVDLRNLEVGEHRVVIQRENIHSDLTTKIDPAYVTVNIEEKVTREFTVDPEINERLLAENYVIKSISAEPKRIRVTGAKSVLDNISFVKASVSSDAGIDKSFSTEADVRVLDKDLTKLDVMIEPQKVKVDVEVEQYSRDIPITLKTKGTPPTGVTIGDLSPSKSSVKVFGSRSALDELKEIPVEVDVSKIDENGSISVDYPKIEGVTKYEDDQLTVNVEITKTLNESSRAFESLDIDVRGLKSSDTYAYVKPTDGQLTLTVSGEADILEQLTKDDFTLFVDASDAKSGENELTVSVEGPNDVTWALSSDQVTIRVTRV